MLKVVILIICFASVLTFCPGTFNGPFLACTFSYEYQDQNCTQFIMDNCTWLQCVQYTTVDNVTQCTQYQTLSSTSWTECVSQCCISSKPYAQTYASLQQCEADVKNFTILIITIVVSIIGGIAFIIIIICCIRRFRANGRQCKIYQIKCFLYLFSCQCFQRRPQNHQKIEIQTYPHQNVEPFTQQKTSNRTCVMCIQKGLIPYQTPFLQDSQKQAYICGACKQTMNL